MLQWKKKKRKEKTTPSGVNLMMSQVLYWAAQDHASVLLHILPPSQELIPPHMG